MNLSNINFKLSSKYTACDNKEWEIGTPVKVFPPMGDDMYNVIFPDGSILEANAEWILLSTIQDHSCEEGCSCNVNHSPYSGVQLDPKYPHNG